MVHTNRGSRNNIHKDKPAAPRKPGRPAEPHNQDRYNRGPDFGIPDPGIALAHRRDSDCNLDLDSLDWDNPDSDRLGLDKPDSDNLAPDNQDSCSPVVPGVHPGQGRMEPPASPVPLMLLNLLFAYKPSTNRNAYQQPDPL
jgi:hypothetical protein